MTVRFRDIINLFVAIACQAMTAWRAVPPHITTRLILLRKWFNSIWRHHLANPSPQPYMRAMTEKWLPIPGYEGIYEVSDHGNVRSTYKRRRNGLLIPFYLGKGYYKAVDLYRDGKRKRVFVHVLVLTAFIGPRPEGKETAHEDGNKANNRLNNLSWKTPIENAADKYRHGTL